MPSQLKDSYYKNCAVPAEVKALAKTREGGENLLNPLLEWGKAGWKPAASVNGGFTMGLLECGPKIKAKRDRFYPGGFEIDKGVGFHQCKLRWDEWNKDIPVDVIATKKGAVIFQGSSDQPKPGVNYISVIDLVKPGL